jgi:hypothetical protein
MKTLLLLLALATSVHAQTNIAATNKPAATNRVVKIKAPAVPQYVVQLNAISNRMAVLNAYQADLQRKMDYDVNRFQLEVDAGTKGIITPKMRAAFNKQHAQYEEAIEEAKRQKAALKIQELDIRQAYKLPVNKSLVSER